MNAVKYNKGGKLNEHKDYECAATCWLSLENVVILLDEG